MIGEFFEIPNIRTLVMGMAAAGLFSEFDASNVFWSLPLATDDGPYIRRPARRGGVLRIKGPIYEAPGWFG